METYEALILLGRLRTIYGSIFRSLESMSKELALFNVHDEVSDKITDIADNLDSLRKAMEGIEYAISSEVEVVEYE